MQENIVLTNPAAARRVSRAAVRLFTGLTINRLVGQIPRLIAPARKRSMSLLRRLFAESVPRT
ncbi:hypothetical protein RRSWK_04977 [Rhodopirellula sp. SWK7]|nr:hypothetical protein RRSWK_04977 [Rhodopirellula sp. SWK7]